MAKPCPKITPKLYLVALIATFLPLVYISIIDQSFRLSIDHLPNEIAARKPVTVKSVIKQDSIIKPPVSNIHKIEKNGEKVKHKPEKDKNQGWKQEPMRKAVKTEGSAQNNSRYLHKTHTNSSAVLGDKEKQFRLCPLLPKRLGKLRFAIFVLYFVKAILT